MILPISIIITHFKQIEYLTTLLKYIKDNNQFEALEVIIIDDHSLKENEILQLKNKHSNFQFYQNQENRGPSYSRNLGVSISKGEYIQFLDADDWISTDKIKIQYEKAVELGSPSFICSEWSRVSFDSEPNNTKIEGIFIPNLNHPTLINIMNHFFPLMSGLILKKSFLEINGFREDMRLIEDVNLSIRLFNFDNNFVLHKCFRPLFFYRTNVKNSLSQSNRQNFNRSIFQNYLTAFQFINKSKRELNDLKQQSFNVLWHVYLETILIEDKELLKNVIDEINSIKLDRRIGIKGKKILLCRILGFNKASKILRLYK